MALVLDTLPAVGRIMLLALLLAVALHIFARTLQADAQSTLQVLYRKGALLALVLVPLATYLLGLQVPVPVDQMVRLQVSWPSYVVYGLVGIWGIGFVVALIRLYKDLQSATRVASQSQIASTEVQSRVKHWSQRLNLGRRLEVYCDGSELPWHVGTLPGGHAASVVLPAAALHWPTGILDAALLSQMCQLKQGCWRWLFFARIVQALYWPVTLISNLIDDLAECLQGPAWRLAAAAYRDKEGWRRDVKNLAKRATSLVAVPKSQVGDLLRLPNNGQVELEKAPAIQVVKVDGVAFDDKLADVKRRKKNKETDPYEQAYWLIALASILVGVATTLTLVPRSPEFEPSYLNIKWQDQMVRRPQADESRQPLGVTLPAGTASKTPNEGD